MRTLSLVLSLLLLVACASNKTAPQLPSDKDFAVPPNLADQFAVKEQSDPAVLPVVAPVPTPEKAPPVTVKKGKKAGRLGKKDKMHANTAKEEVIPNRWTMTPFFQTGEHYTFDITYFGATAGELELEILPPKLVNDRLTYHLRAMARTSSIFSLFYRLNDVAESFLDTEGLFSHKFSLKLDESLQERDVLELYDHRKHKVYYWSKLNHKKKGLRNDQVEFDMPPFTQDSVSSFFYLRTLPLRVGDVYQFPVATNGKMREVRVTTLRKEKLSTKIGEFDTIVVKPEVVLDGALKTYGDNFVWVSDDPQRLLLKVDAKIKVGSIIGYLKEHSYGGSKPAQR